MSGNGGAASWRGIGEHGWPRPQYLPESQSHFAFVDATTSTTPHFRLIAVNLNH
jgi:hypothetical protein